MSDPRIPAAMRGAIDLSVLKRPEPGSEKVPTGVTFDDTVRQCDDARLAEFLELSRTVPVVLVFWSPRSVETEQFVGVCAAAARSSSGKLVLAVVDADQSPQLVSAVRIESLPTVLAVLGGRPAPLFAGIQTEEAVKQVFAQLLQVAADMGLSAVGGNGTEADAGSADAGGGGAVDSGTGDATAASAANVEPRLPPLHQEGLEALERGDYAAAAAAYRTAIAQNPRDAEAELALRQVTFLERVAGYADSAPDTGAAPPDDFDAVLRDADLDFADGNIAGALTRILDRFATFTAEEKPVAQARLVEYFELAGPEVPDVQSGRRRLASLLF